MIGLDTNILVRLLVEDDPTQTEKARLFIERNCTPESPGFVNCVVLAELVWVLESVYRFGRAEIAAAVDSVVAGRDRMIEHHDAVLAALDDFRSTNIDFGDSLIARINLAKGCRATATFDRKAARLGPFVGLT